MRTMLAYANRWGGVERGIEKGKGNSGFWEDLAGIEDLAELENYALFTLKVILTQKRGIVEVYFRISLF